tara:strand:- start:3985 stop:4086 length:102 start_codon:yes stop_codon:yes gene_type:complete
MIASPISLASSGGFAPASAFRRPEKATQFFSFP